MRPKKKSWGHRLNHLRLAGLKIGGDVIQVTSEAADNVRRRVSAPAIPTVGRLLSNQSSTGSDPGDYRELLERPASVDVTSPPRGGGSAKDGDGDDSGEAGAGAGPMEEYNGSILEAETDNAHFEFKEAVQHLLLKYPSLSASNCQRALNEALTFLDRADPFALESKEVGEYELVITVVQARNLKSADSNGLSDPYAKMNVVSYPSNIAVVEEKTQTIMKTLDPTWNAETRYAYGTRRGPFILYNA